MVEYFAIATGKFECYGEKWEEKHDKNVISKILRFYHMFLLFYGSHWFCWYLKGQDDMPKRNNLFSDKIRSYEPSICFSYWCSIAVSWWLFYLKRPIINYQIPLNKAKSWAKETLFIHRSEMPNVAAAVAKDNEDKFGVDNLNEDVKDEGAFCFNPYMNIDF